ncbi:MAG: hypothetical protein JNK19_08310 [Tabrizicola sp.]|nr:hypothetical protein [Tabrizicola sp.]
MLVNALLSLHRMALLAALTVALVATGFAHRMPAPQDETLAFALANGVTLADFCGDPEDGHARGRVHCPACQLTGSADLPGATGALIDLELAFLGADFVARNQPTPSRKLDPSHSPQGPPAV